jgi:hypothetical protein
VLVVEHKRVIDYILHLLLPIIVRNYLCIVPVQAKEHLQSNQMSLGLSTRDKDKCASNLVRGRILRPYRPTHAFAIVWSQARREREPIVQHAIAQHLRLCALRCAIPILFGWDAEHVRNLTTVGHPLIRGDIRLWVGEEVPIGGHVICGGVLL